MKEELLHHVWKTKRFDLDDLRTVDGEAISIKNFGLHNHNAGPDFLDARVQIDNKLWAGHIEIHINASDWKKHLHHHDEAYNNVILHVVYNNDKPIANENGQQLPTLELKERIPEKYLSDYRRLTQSLNWVPCAQQLPRLDQKKWPFFFERVLVSRLMKKKERIDALLQKTKNDWEEVLYRLLLRYMGLKVNGAAFETLADHLPYALLKKQVESVEEKESILLGQAGILEAKDDYTTHLAALYKHQKNKFSLLPMTGVEWKFSRLRPANFPSVRMAQIATLYHATPKLFNAFIHSDSVTAIEKILDVTASPYWDQHYLPGKESAATRKKKIGQTTKQVLIINAVIPLIFAYGITLQDEALKEKALDLFSALPSEKNNILSRWKEHGVKAQSAAQSQALIELKTDYCDNYNCLNCQIGQQIIFS
jgi:hypothetical protein